jgi:hypothetical protein
MSTRKGTLESTWYCAGTVVSADEDMPLVQDEASLTGFEEVTELWLVEWRLGRLYKCRLAGERVAWLTRQLHATMSTRNGTLESTWYCAGTVVSTEVEMPLVQDEASVLGFEEVAELG